MLENKLSPSISDSWIHLLQRPDPTSSTDKVLKRPRWRRRDPPILDPMLAKNDASLLSSFGSSMVPGHLLGGAWAGRCWMTGRRRV